MRGKNRSLQASGADCPANNRLCFFLWRLPETASYFLNCNNGKGLFTRTSGAAHNIWRYLRVKQLNIRACARHERYDAFPKFREANGHVLLARCTRRIRNSRRGISGGAMACFLQ